MQTLDMTEILLEAYQLADHIKESNEVNHYLACKKRLEEDLEAQKIIQGFQKMKERLEEVQRFGIFHPEYHQVKEEAQVYQERMLAHSIIGDYLEAEKNLDHLLYEVSSMIAHSVSDSIKVPVNEQKKSIGKKCGGN
ncbi:YlbF family regulator [Hazenella coriacea]|uniref:Cell fate (Sporulation/competence/biofilm development) regulator YlbF (YheA/YmcA/DUF963 family) n=1 Tax=Hazenella coriacea TaxID=1179467 RepID=A0A4R3LBX2_9BACL|nr:YlbF family regulator [Hazenella coriacea]TCS95016.1 cell fate (sporulation/competence/biofilm development) regulator YlbF (YheA/YmcA/DUF963 family) [Hazenella coriacea]